MRGFALALLAAPSVAQPALFTGGSGLVNDPAHIAVLNAQEGSTWVAAPQRYFEGLTWDDARVLLGTRLSHISEHLNKTLPDSWYALLNDDDVPSDFDSRKQWKDLIHPIRDQQRCGSCWAFSASEVLSDRAAIAAGKPSAVLSAEDMVSCDKGDMGCSGGYLDHAWKYLTDTGIVTDTCFPYSAGSGKAATCVATCVDSQPFAKTKAKSMYAIKGAANMQKDVMMSGPIQIAFKVYQSFMLYRKGIYHKHPHDAAEGGHAVKIVGWGLGGKHGKTKYWTVANSWNTDWGEEGFFRIARGRDECGIESMGPPFAGLPARAAPAEEMIVV